MYKKIAKKVFLNTKPKVSERKPAKKAKPKFIEPADNGTILVKSPYIEDYFKILPPMKSIDEYYEAYGDQIAKWYEEGKVIIFEKIPFKYDAALLNEVKFPTGREFQKLVSKDLLRTLHRNFASGRGHPLNQVFGKNVEFAKRFQHEITAVNEQMTKLSRLLFPKYVFDQKEESMTWRFTTTSAEGLHLDSFLSKYDKTQQLRMFINMDSVPRIWNSSHSLDTLIEKYYKPNANRLNTQQPNEFNRILSKIIFGAAGKPFRNNMPKHTAMFAPGTLWMANSLLIPHEIFFGRRMVSGSFFADINSMHNPEKSFYNKVTSLAKQTEKSQAA